MTSLTRTRAVAARWKGSDGIVRWKLPNGDFHRLDGPALIRPDGTEEWWQHNERHRDDGPAMTWSDGREEWWQNDERHRTDGPAMISPVGRFWFQNDKLHRTDGPAVTKRNGRFALWYIEGYLVNVEQETSGAFQNERERLRLSPVELDEIDFSPAFEPEFARQFLHVMDSVEVTLLTHDNPSISAVAAWHLPVDDHYFHAALDNPVVRTVMQHRDVPDHMRTLLEVVS